MALKNFGIVSPVLGLTQNYPSLLLKDAYLPDYLDDIDNIFFFNGEIHRSKLISKEFSQMLPDRVLHYDQYWQKDRDWWLILCTKRDIAWRDSANDRLAYITPQYAVGTSSFVNGSTTVTGAGGADYTNLKAGDFITIGATYTTDDTWYEIDSITDATHLELTENYAEANSGAVAYLARVTYAGTNNDFWESVTFNDTWIAVNGADSPQAWAGVNQCADLAGTPPTAKHIIVYENYVILGNLVTGTEPYTYEWCALGDETNWTTGDSGSAQIDDYHPINGFALLQGFLIILSEKTLEKVWMIGGSLVFNRKRITNEVGLWAPRSIIKTRESIYFYSYDHTFRCFTGINWRPISTPIRTYCKNLHPEYDKYIHGLYNEEYDLNLWTVPDSTSSGNNNAVLMYDLKSNKDVWSKKAIEICAFGTYEVEDKITWATLPYTSWNNWAWDIWDTREGFESAPHDLGSDYSGYTYRLFSSELNNGASYNGSFVLATDLTKDKKGFFIYKRLTKITLVFRNEGAGTVDVYVKKDYTGSWTLLTSVSLDGTTDFLFLDVNCNLLAKNFLFKCIGANAFRFLGIVFPEFDMLGPR